MQFSMKNLDQLSLSEMENLVSSSRKLTWNIDGVEAEYAWIAAVLKTQRYAKLGKLEKGIVRRFLQKVTATSRAQLTPLIGQWIEERKIVRRSAARPNFAVRYTRAGIVLLAVTDAAHEDLSGPALRRILLRQFEVFGKQDYERLARIPVPHLYNLRKSTVYRSQRVRVNHTHSRQIAIGERRKPDPKGKPGISARGHRSSRPERRQSRSLLRQFGGHSDAVAEHRMCGNHQRNAHDSGSGGYPAPVSVPDYRLSLRQRKRVFELPSRQDAEQAADRVHQVACPTAPPATHWWKAKTELSFASTSATGSSPPNTPNRSSASSRHNSIRT